MPYMSTDTTLQIDSISSEETEQIGRLLGSNIKGGEVIELASDLGGGKTILVRGLAKGMGSHDQVASPSFTVTRIYEVSKMVDGQVQTKLLYHFDFYRLNDGGLIAHELSDALQDSRGVVVLEWAGIVQDVLPVERLKVSIEKTGDSSRQITLNCPEKLKYLLGGLDKR
jgi:tRNA threonylcarbamoyladenosine biosynthesis protein TsaE